MTRVAIIGAGFSGLSLAKLLKDNFEITLFEKSRGVGGRISTRNEHGFLFDHGAQYFTAKTSYFKDFIRPLIDKNIIKKWSANYLKFEGSDIIERKKWCTQDPRYVGVPSMNQMCISLAKGLDINKSTKIVELSYEEKWSLKDDKGTIYSGFDWVICALPSPQAKELLPYYFKYYNDIKSINMNSCFSIMLGFKNDIPLDFEAAHIINSDLSWIFVNSRKPNRSGGFTLVIHSSNEYAKSNINKDHNKVMQHLIDSASRVLDVDLNIAYYKAIHRWLYAGSNEKKEQTGKIFLDQRNRLAACGDWNLGSQVESAFNSAYNLSLKIKEVCL